MSLFTGGHMNDCNVPSGFFVLEHDRTGHILRVRNMRANDHHVLSCHVLILSKKWL